MDAGPFLGRFVADVSGPLRKGSPPHGRESGRGFGRTGGNKGNWSVGVAQVGQVLLIVDKSARAPDCVVVKRGLATSRLRPRQGLEWRCTRHLLHKASVLLLEARERGC